MILSACSTVDRRCAITKVVRLRTSSRQSRLDVALDSVSSAEVASSRIRIGASLSSARAIAMRWRWPPESNTPRSPDHGVEPGRIAPYEFQHVRRSAAC